MSAQSLQPAVPASLLRRTLLGNALFSLFTSMVCLVAASALAAWTGLQPCLFTGLGVLVLPFALGVGWLALRVADIGAAGRIVLALDLAWVGSSIVLLLTGWLPLTVTGWWTVAIVTDVVAIFALLEYLGLRRMGKVSGGRDVEPTLA